MEVPIISKKDYQNINKESIFQLSKRLPVELIYFEGHKSKLDTHRREKYFKTTKGKTTLNTMLKGRLGNSKVYIAYYRAYSYGILETGESPRLPAFGGV